MKKIFISTMAAFAILFPTSLCADEPAKEYNMVITLQNGTTITLGHNDIKDITFNGEEISISGNVANTIEEINERAYVALDRTYMLEDRMYAEIENINAKITYQEATTNDLIAYIDGKLHELMCRIDILEATEEDTKNDVEQLKAYADELRNLIEQVKGQLGI
ncbi:MAG: hypothetical protein K2L22_03355 [Muribaculaceae bacterium]|nr:hypothetical protein [Muribaculaceae bacterium]